jgi:hypothetical protein
MDWRKGAQGSQLNPIYCVKVDGNGLQGVNSMAHFLKFIDVPNLWTNSLNAVRDFPEPLFCALKCQERSRSP